MVERDRERIKKIERKLKQGNKPAKKGGLPKKMEKKWLLSFASSSVAAAACFLKETEGEK